MSAIREITKQACDSLVDGGWLMFEHGWEQGPAVREILADSGFAMIETLKDLQGHERVTVGEKAS